MGIAMTISILIRHFFFLGLIILGMILLIHNYKIAGNIMRARELGEYRGDYYSGDYVTVDFDDVLYMEYDGLYGGRQKRYDVYGTPDSSVYYVNGLDAKYILLEITDEKMIEKMDSGQMGKQKVLGIIYPGTFDVDEFLVGTDGKAEVEKRIVVRQVEQPDLFVKKMLMGLAFIGLGIVLFAVNGGMASVVRRRTK